MNATVKTSALKNLLKKFKPFIDTNFKKGTYIRMTVNNGFLHARAVNGIRAVYHRIPVFDQNGEFTFEVPLFDIPKCDKDSFTMFDVRDKEVLVSTYTDGTTAVTQLFNKTDHSNVNIENVIEKPENRKVRIFFAAENLISCIQAFDKDEQVEICYFKENAGILLRSRKTSVYCLPLNVNKMSSIEDKLYTGPEAFKNV